LFVPLLDPLRRADRTVKLAQRLALLRTLTVLSLTLVELVVSRVTVLRLIRLRESRIKRRRIQLRACTPSSHRQSHPHVRPSRTAPRVSSRPSRASRAPPPPRFPIHRHFPPRPPRPTNTRASVSQHTDRPTPLPPRRTTTDRPPVRVLGNPPPWIPSLPTPPTRPERSRSRRTASSASITVSSTASSAIASVVSLIARRVLARARRARDRGAIARTLAIARRRVSSSLHYDVNPPIRRDGCAIDAHPNGPRSRVVSHGARRCASTRRERRRAWVKT